jgi:hypothetical protein
MRRRLLIVAMAVGVGAALALPGVSSAQAPAQDSVIGSGSSSIPGCNGPVEISVQSGPSGENPTGQMTCGSLFNGPVTCLNVSGNVALLTVQDSVFGAVGVRITDAGPTGDGLEAFLGAGCPTPLSSYLDFEFTGDIVVVDAQPFPTSTDQCKNGGWRTFGVFKNQGDCVSFVATKGKNPPAAGP